MKCLVCGSEKIFMRPTKISDFLVARIWGNEEVAKEHSVNLCHCEECSFSFYDRRLTDDESGRLYEEYRGDDMDRNEFVSTLRAVLTGEVPASVVEDNVRYYDSYISQEIAGGKSEREVMESLGEPRLIAKTIIDTNGSSQGRETYGGSYTQSEPEKGFHAEFNEDGGVDLKYRQFNLNT